MSTINLPAAFEVSQYSLTQVVNSRAFASPYGGSEQVVDMLNDRWHIALTLSPSVYTQAAALEAFISSLRAGVNTVNLYHMARKAPTGTMRGSMTLAAAAAIGAASLSVTATGQAGATLKAGDMLGVGGLLVMVASDATAAGTGAITVSLVNRLRTALALGSVVTWDKPSAPFRVIGKPAVVYLAGYAESVALDFVEAVS